MLIAVFKSYWTRDPELSGDVESVFEHALISFRTP